MLKNNNIKKKIFFYLIFKNYFNLIFFLNY